MSIIWYKVWHDLWRNKLRTLLIVLSTAAGVFALGLVFGMSDVIHTRFTESHRASVAPHIEFYTSRFDQDVVDAILREPGVPLAVDQPIWTGMRFYNPELAYGLIVGATLGISWSVIYTAMNLRARRSK